MPSEPPRIDKLRSPSCTFLPSASEAFASIVGRNLLTGMKKGRTNTITISARTAMPIHFNLLLMDSSGRAGVGGRLKTHGGRSYHCGRGQGRFRAFGKTFRA